MTIFKFTVTILFSGMRKFHIHTDFCKLNFGKHNVTWKQTWTYSPDEEDVVGVFNFVDEADAVMFKLKFGGY